MLTLENAKKVQIDGEIKYLYNGKYYTKEKMESYFNELNREAKEVLETKLYLEKVVRQHEEKVRQEETETCNCRRLLLSIL